ncbi:MAG: cupin domain-containing protein [Microbacterium gubbeenense]|uniref:cupin domain-containing protein n=1 Tax=Microbacterium gubbeenense TaxID=159896 RepID=UPI003F99713E
MTAEVLRPADAELRFGDWGPAYLSKTDAAAFGTVVLRPGDAFDNHAHEHHTESFVAVEGEAEVWIDRTHRATLAAGEVLHAEPGEEHFLRNVSDRVFRAVFVKTPWVDGDKVDHPWQPGDTQ